MNSFAIMILFLTRIPLPYKVRYDEDELAKGIKLMPLVGLLIGGLLYGASTLLGLIGFEKGITVAVCWTLYVVITGGLHIDGLADTFDGIYSNREKARVLEIMKDSQIGTFGVLGIVAVLGIGLVSSYHMDSLTYLIFPIAGRSIALLVCGANKYAREDGMGRAFVDRCGTLESTIGALVGLCAAYLAMGTSGAFGWLLSAAVTVMAVKKIAKKIDGITGDVIGYTIEISQSIFLLGTYTVLKIMELLH